MTIRSILLSELKMPVSTEVNGTTASETMTEQVNVGEIENSDTVKFEEKTSVNVDEAETPGNTNGHDESSGSVKFTPINVDVVDGVDSPMTDEVSQSRIPFDTITVFSYTFEILSFTFSLQSSKRGQEDNFMPISTLLMV